MRWPGPQQCQTASSRRDPTASVILNLHVARHFMPAGGLPETEFLGYGKYCVSFDPRMIELLPA
jgi:hypothetical protein